MRFILCEDVGKPGGTCTTWDDGSTCPNRGNHTPLPGGYVQRLDWYEELDRTHVQRRCKGCGLWAIWEPKEQPAPVLAAGPHDCPSCRCRSKETTDHA